MKNRTSIIAAVLMVLTAGGLAWTRLGGSAVEKVAERGRDGDRGGHRSGGEDAAENRKTKSGAVRVATSQELKHREWALRQEWIRTDPLAKVAGDLHKEHSLWYLNGGSEEKDSSQAFQQLRKNQDACARLKLVIQMETLARMLETPGMNHMTDALFKKNFPDEAKRNWMVNQWNDPDGFMSDLEGVPEDVRTALREDSAKVVRDLRAEHRADELQRQLPPALVEWFRKAVEASVYAGAAEAYLTNHGSPELQEVRKQLRHRSAERQRKEALAAQQDIPLPLRKMEAVPVPGE